MQRAFVLVFEQLPVAGAAAAIGTALLVDHLWGVPPVGWHPVVWMGHALGWAGKRVAPLVAHAPAGRDLKSYCCSALLWFVLFAITGLTAWGVPWVLRQLPSWPVAMGLWLCLKPLLAWRMLRSEVLAVETALGQSGEAKGKRLEATLPPWPLGAWRVSVQVPQAQDHVWARLRRLQS